MKYDKVDRRHSWKIREQVKIVCSSAKMRRRRAEFQENRDSRKSWSYSISYYETFLLKT